MLLMLGEVEGLVVVRVLTMALVSDHLLFVLLISSDENVVVVIWLLQQ